MSDTEYPRPALTADVALFRYHGARLQILLIERLKDPFAGRWALPGGFVDPGESPAEAAARELAEETQTEAHALLPLPVAGTPGRDPRGWVVSVPFLGLARSDAWAMAGDDAKSVRWFRLTELPELAFDHAGIIESAQARLAELCHLGPVPLSLLQSPFRTRQARHLYSQILGQPIQPRPFKAWLRRRHLVQRVGPARFEANDHVQPDWLR